MKNHLFNYTGPNYSPSLKTALPNNSSQREILSELSLFDDIKVTGLNETQLLNYYKSLSEMYALHMEASNDAIKQLISSDGAISEMYLEVYTYEQSKGETERSVKQRGRLAIVQNTIELLRSYFNKFEQCKFMLKNSLDERLKLITKVNEQQTEIETLKKQLKF